MNKRNEWKELLEQANVDLKKYNIWMKISEEDGFFTLYLMQGGKQPYTFAENYYENELCELINDAWAHARAKGKHEKRQEEYKIPALDRKMHLLGESIQEVTLAAWPVIWADNKYDQDSRIVLETIRRWGWAFENWWLGHTDEWIETHDYIEEIVKFTDKKCREYLKELGVESGAIEIVEEQTGKVIASTPTAEDRGHMEETIDVMLDIANYAEERFATDVRDRDVERELNKEWAREFSKWYYCELSDDERIEKDYYESLCEFVERKLTEYKEPKPKDYIVRINRVEKYEADVLVSATSEEEAEKKVEEAWGDGKHDWLYEKMTENVNCDSQTYKARQAYSTEEHYDFSI